MVKFLVLGNKNAVAYKNVFELIKDNKIWLGCTSPNEYILPNGIITKKVNGLCRWFSNLETDYRNEKIALYKCYNSSEYPKYDNYDAINVNKTSEIPCDYNGVMGVPISFLDKYCPEQFEILWIMCGHSKTTMPIEIKKLVRPDFEMKSNIGTKGYGIVKGHQEYHRILIRRIS